MKKLHLAYAALAVLVCGAAQANLLTNGSFEAALPGGYATFGSEYQKNVSAYGEGTVNIGFSPFDVHLLWANYAPHDGQRQLIVNGATSVTPSTGAKVVWEQAVTLTGGVAYLFEGWARSSYPTNPSLLEVSFASGAANTLLGTFQLTSNTGVWQLMSGNITTGATASGMLQIRDLDIHPSGNDFSLDSLSLTTAVPEPETYALMLAGLAAVGFLTRRRSRA